MTVAQLRQRVGQAPITAAQNANPSSPQFVDLPRAHYLGALEMHIKVTPTVTAGAVVVIDTTLGPTALVKNVRFVLDGKTIPLDVPGKFLDFWSHIDRPGMDRLVVSSTTTAVEWDAVLRYELAQSIGNLTGSIPLWMFASARLQFDLDTTATIATGTNISLNGNIDVYCELYDQTAGLQIDTSVVHCLRYFDVSVTASGPMTNRLPAGRQLERLIVIVENNGLYVWNLVDDMTFQMGPGDQPYYSTTPVFRAQQARMYGSSDIPIAGVYTFDFRQAGPRDVVPMGDRRFAPDPYLLATISATPALTNAKLHIIMEELEPVVPAMSPAQAA